MRVLQLQAENFKRLLAVEISPQGDVVKIGGKNGSGKSSVLDAIYVALKGRSAAPPKPVRTGEEECLIKLDLGDLKIIRTFKVKDGAQYTDTVKVENADGLRYQKPQEVLDALLGEIGFDPFEFVQMKPKEQAETLLQMVPLSVDLDQFAQLDASDFAKRRDINRDGVSVRAQVEAIPTEEVPEDLPDRAALVDQLGNAANTNAEIERARLAREETRRAVAAGYERVKQLREQIARLTAEADTLESDTRAKDSALGELEPLPEPVDTDAIRTQLQAADAILARAERQKRKADLESQLEALRAQSQALTDAMADREKQRNDALAKAKMPIEGLAFGIDEKGHPVVQFGGVPFEQASTAEQLRASTAIAMAANPELRVLRVKDGALLDDDSMKLLADMAAAQDFQLWVEIVGTGGVGVVMEDGQVKGANGDDADPLADAVAEIEAGPPAKKPAAKKAASKADGALL